MLLPLLALFLLPLCITASADTDHAKLVQLAAKHNGVIKLDDSSYKLLTNPKRTWSASVQFTALDKRRRCGPCRCVFLPLTHTRVV